MRKELKDRIRISGFSDEIDSALDIQMRVVKDLGMEYLSLRGIDGENIGAFTAERFEAEVLPRLSQAGVKVSSIGSPVGKVFIQDEEGFLKQQDVLREMAKIARLLGTRYIRIFSFYIPEGEDPDIYEDQVLEKLRVFVDIAKAHDVMLIHENEKDIYGDTKERCHTLFEALDPEHFRGIFDFANFVQVGEEPLECHDLLKKHIEYIHIKDAVSGHNQNVLAGTGDGKIPELLEAFLDDGYKGFLTLEPHLVVFDSLKDLELQAPEEVIKGDKGLDGATAYRMQYEALRNILEEIRI